MWVTGYYPGWQQQTLKPTDIDFRVVTHLIYFSLIPRADGTVDATKNSLTDANAAAVVAAAHAAHRKALVSIGGENSGPAFQQAIAPGVRDTFVQNIVSWATSRGFDGVDIDMEPTLPEDAPNFQAFIHELRTALRAANPHSLLTSAVGVTPAIYKPIADDIDQINLMTYDMSGPWEGWETWYNSCLSNGGRTFKSTGQPLPSCERMVSDMIAGGVPTSKIGIGICMNGVVWHGATAPNQPIAGVTTEGVSYNQVMDKYYAPERYHWDSAAKAPYLSIDAPQQQDQAFVSYDDAKACAAKIAYVRREHLGGVIVWELASGYRPDADAANRSPLLTAIGKAVAGQPR
jgi:chitinase